MRRGTQKSVPKTEAEARELVNELSARKQLLERDRVEAVRTLFAFRADKIRALEGPDEHLPFLEGREWQDQMRREGLLRERVGLEPDHWRALKQMADLDAENARRLGSAA